MSKAMYVYSTLAAAVTYRGFQKTEGDVPVPSEGVTINGGSGVMARKSLETPQGVATRVTAEQLEILNSDPVFQMHKKNGYIKVSEHHAEPEAVASDMESRDASAQLQEGDFNPDDTTQAQPADGKASTKRKA